MTEVHVPINFFNNGLSSGIYNFVQKDASKGIAKVYIILRLALRNFIIILTQVLYTNLCPRPLKLDQDHGSGFLPVSSDWTTDPFLGRELAMSRQPAGT